MNALATSLLLAVTGAQDLADRIDAEVRPFVECGDFAGAILVADGEQVLFRRAYGLASIDLDVPNTADTAYGVGSVSKLFTALAFVRLSEQGILDLDDELARFLPRFPGAEEITLRMLLGHRSGLRHAGYAVDVPGEVLAPITSSELTRRIGTYPRVGAPGERRVYSTAGYSVLARALEVITGLPYEDALGRLVFEPAGMTSSGDLSARRTVPGRAVGYEPDFGTGVRSARPIAFANKLGGGSCYSTVGDLHRLALAVDRGLVVSAKGREELELSGWGGDRMRNGDHAFFGSNGSVDGYMAVFDRYLDRELYVVLLGNVNSGAREYLRDALLSLPLELPFERAPRYEAVPQASDEDPRDVLGLYRITPTIDWAIRRVGAELGIGTPGSRPMPLLRLGRDRYFLRARYAELRFVRESMGESSVVTGLEWFEAGERFQCERLE